MATQNVFLNAVSEKMLHTNAKKDGSGEFVNITIPCSKSKTGYASFGVNAGQVMQATKKDGTAIDGMKNVLLGKPEGVRQVSVCTKVTKKGDKSYGNIEMTNAEIAAEFDAARKAYKAAQATE